MSGLEGARCLVLGASGFIGTNLCVTLLAQGAHVEGFGRRQPQRQVLASVPWHVATFSDRGSLARAIDGQDYVIHLIGNGAPALSNADPARDVEEMMLPSIRLIDECHNAGVRRLIFASSGGTVYGITGPAMIAEDHPTNPITAYAINKLALEKYLGLARRLHDLDSIVLRIANPYGPYQLPDRPQGVIGALFARALAGETLQVWGDGSVIRDFVHVRDVAAAIVLSLQYAGCEWIFNVGSEKGRSLRTVVDAVAEVAGLPSQRIEYMPGRAADVPINVLNCDLIKREMGWRPIVEWRAGLAETGHWMASAMASGNERSLNETEL